jgi:hypothetical protein
MRFLCIVGLSVEELVSIQKGADEVREDGSAGLFSLVPRPRIGCPPKMGFQSSAGM